MIYFLVFIVLMILELVYFKIADHFNIIDKPNERSSHDTVTLRGGGVIFYIAALLYFFLSGYQYPFFFLGLTLMCGISFLDDVYTLSDKLRLSVHFLAVLLMAYQMHLFMMPWYFLTIGFIIIVGVINAYNFMDGINGITGSYSLAVGGLLMWVNANVGFIDQDFLLYILLSVIVFSFFNFRMKAKCFAGDVGSVGIAYILLFALGLLILTTGNFIYFLFLAVYGVDAIWTIIRRLYRKENIFKAHRSHLYQYLANEAGINKLVVSSAYALLQMLIGALVVYYSSKNQQVQILFAAVLLISLSALYLLAKTYVIKKFAKNYSPLRS